MRTTATTSSARDASQRQPLSAAHASVGRSLQLSTVPTGSATLRRKPSCACGGECPRCQNQVTLQTKLKVGEPGDRYEQEADRIADEVMRMPEPLVQRQIKPEEEEEGMVQREAIANQLSPAPAETTKLFRFLFGAGAVRFRECNQHGNLLDDFAVIPEEGNESFTPEDNRLHTEVDGFWWRYHEPRNEWMKIPDDCNLEVTCTEQSLSRVQDCTINDVGWTSDGHDVSNPFG